MPAGMPRDVSSGIAPSPRTECAARAGADAADGNAIPAGASPEAGIDCASVTGAVPVKPGAGTAVPVPAAASGDGTAPGAAAGVVGVGTRHSQRPRSFSWHCQPPLCRANTSIRTFSKRNSPAMDKFYPSEVSAAAQSGRAGCPQTPRVVDRSCTVRQRAIVYPALSC
jgi:hypothetical protein